MTTPDHDEQLPERKDLRGLVARGLGWKVATQVIGIGTRSLVTLVLARLLLPAEFGLAALALSLAALVYVIADLSLAATLVQRATITEKDCSTVFWSSSAIGLLLFGLGVGLSWPIAAVFGEPDVQPLLAALSVSFLFTAMSTTHMALLTRRMIFRSTELIQIVGLLAGAAAGLTVAFADGGAWAIIIQRIAASLVVLVLLVFFVRWRPRLIFSMDSLKDLTGFSLNLLGHNFLGALKSNADNLLIGRFLGPSALGIYAISYSIVLYPSSRLANPLRQVLFPAFSRMQDDLPGLARAWLRASRLVASVAAPVLLALVVVAGDFVPVVLGDNWRDAVPVLQVLAWVGFLISFQAMFQAVLMARDRTGTLFRFSIAYTGLSIAAFAVGLYWGVVGVAVAYCAAMTVLTPIYAYLAANTVGVSLLDYFRALRGVVEACAVMLGAMAAVRYGLVQQDVPAAARLAILIVLGAAVYIPVCLWRCPDVLQQILKRIRRGRASAATEPEGAS